MGDIAIRVEKLGKRYRLGGGRGRDLLKEAFGRRAAAPASEVLWALRDVSFELRRGEVVGIIGHNGAGKSVLLRVLARITQPSAGFAEVHGSVGSLLEVGTGFHPDLTGRENVFLSGAILGMTRREIQRRFEEIVDFSGVRDFIDSPVKRYSTGMTVRLAFAVAAHLETEILFLDEVWAVGDHEFQERCARKMRELCGSGRTALIVSHGLGQIQEVCKRSLCLDHGRLIADGPTADVIRRYTSAPRRVDAA